MLRAMCGRAKLATDYAAIAAELGLDAVAPAPNLRPSWNIAPSDDVLIVLRDPKTNARVAKIVRWGLIPSWSETGVPEYATFNARAESIAQRAAFRESWRRGRRCLVVTDGFYEWRKGDKQPFAIARAKGKLTVMAGLWDLWISPAGEKVPSCTIVTTPANALLAPLHERMPAILAESDWPAWLGEVPADEGTLKALLKPYPSEDMVLWPVDRKVGNVHNNDPNVSEPIVTA